MSDHLPASVAYAGANTAGRRAWHRLGDSVQIDQRAARVANLVWEYAYPAVYSGAYREAAQLLRDQAQRYPGHSGSGHDWVQMPTEARVTLVGLSVAAGNAVEDPTVIPDVTIGSATLQQARHAATTHGGGEPAGRAVIQAAWDDACRYAAAHGVLHASQRILADWNAHTTTAQRELPVERGVTTVTGWAHQSIARINREVLDRWIGQPPAAPAPTVRGSYVAATTPSPGTAATPSTPPTPAADPYAVPRYSAIRPDTPEDWLERMRPRVYELLETGAYPHPSQAWQAAYREDTARQRRALEDQVLAAAHQLDPADTSPEARLVRESAASIGEHRASDAARPQRPEAAGRPAAAGGPARLAATSFATPASSAPAAGTAADAGAVSGSARQVPARAAGGASHRRSR